MFSVKYFILCVGIVAASLSSVNALTDEERNKVREALMPYLGECAKEFGLEKEAIIAAKQKGELGNFDPCLYACFYKKIGFMNAQGLLDTETALTKVKKYTSSADDIAKATEVANECAKANDAPVTDGEKGCDRAKLIFNCMHQHREKFQFQ